MDEEKVSIQVEDETFEIHFEGWKYFSQKELLFGILSEVNEGLELPLDDPESRVLFDKSKPIFSYTTLRFLPLVYPGGSMSPHH